MPMNRMDETLGHSRQVIEIRQKIRFSKIDAPDSERFFFSLLLFLCHRSDYISFKKKKTKKKTLFLSHTSNRCHYKEKEFVSSERKNKRLEIERCLISPGLMRIERSRCTLDDSVPVAVVMTRSLSLSG